MEICLVFLIFLKTGWGEFEIRKLFSSQWRRGLISASHASGRRIGPHQGPHLSQKKKNLFFFFFFFFKFTGAVVVFSNHPFIGIDSETFYFILELFQEAWECGYNNNNSEEKITSGVSILIRQHYALIDNLTRGNSPKRSVSRTLAPLSPAQGYPHRWEGTEVHKLFTVCTKQVRFPYTEHAANGI